MSHFTVTVCLDGSNEILARACRVAADGSFDADGRAQLLRGAAEAALAGTLAPFDENTEVTPYRSYEDGGPEDYWFVRSLREEAGLNPDDATLTWAQVAEAYNKHYSEDGETLLTDESGRAYTMSTYNPESKWDWWQIGGRWGGRFPYRQKHAGEVIPAEPHWSSDHAAVPARHCDGGPVRALDLEKMREDAAKKAREQYAEYLAAVAGTPEALPWSVFTDNISEGNGYDIGQAREEYHSQPRIKALQESPDFGPFRDNEDFQMPEDLYVERARARAVPGWAVLTMDGRWMERGQMGWWGLNDATENSSIGYWEAANAYIGSLPGDAWLISVDCHI